MKCDAPDGERFFAGREEILIKNVGEFVARA
jgi:hypothetical protein